MASDAPDGGDLRCEPSVAVRGDVVVVSWNDSRGGRTGSPTGVAVAWSMSRDAGRTFRFGGYLAPCASGVVAGADSRVVVDADGDFFLLVTCWTSSSQALRVFRMTHDALGEWKEAAVADRSDGKPYLDKPALAGGPERVGFREDALVIFPSLAMVADRPAVMAYVRPDPARSTLTDVELALRGKDGVWTTTTLSSVSTAWESVPGDAKWAPIQRNFGDYVTLASDGGRLAPAWTDGRTRAPRIFVRVAEIGEVAR